jgi:hypothetical protein
MDWSIWIALLTAIVGIPSAILGMLQIVEKIKEGKTNKKEEELQRSSQEEQPRPLLLSPQEQEHQEK